LNRMGTTILIATHDQAMINKFGHPKLILDSGKMHMEDPKHWLARKIDGVF